MSPGWLSSKANPPVVSVRKEFALLGANSSPVREKPHQEGWDHKIRDAYP